MNDVNMVRLWMSLPQFKEVADDIKFEKGGLTQY